MPSFSLESVRSCTPLSVGGLLAACEAAARGGVVEVRVEAVVPDGADLLADFYGVHAHFTSACLAGRTVGRAVLQHELIGDRICRAERHGFLSG